MVISYPLGVQGTVNDDDDVLHEWLGLAMVVVPDAPVVVHETGGSEGCASTGPHPAVVVVAEMEPVAVEVARVEQEGTEGMDKIFWYLPGGPWSVPVSQVIEWGTAVMRVVFAVGMRFGVVVEILVSAPSGVVPGSGSVVEWGGSTHTTEGRGAGAR